MSEDVRFISTVSVDDLDTNIVGLKEALVGVSQVFWVSEARKVPIGWDVAYTVYPICWEVFVIG